MSQERWRCFVAVPIDEDVRLALAAAAVPWHAYRGLRWVPDASWHLTLAFLGSVEASAVDGVRATIADVARRNEPMRLRGRGLGAFPSAARARVVWYGVDDRAGRLAAIAGDLGTGLGLEDNAPYKAHITMARALRGSADVRGWLAAASASAPALALTVGRLELMRSHLGSGTPRYERLAVMDLGSGVHA